MTLAPINAPLIQRAGGGFIGCKVKRTTSQTVDHNVQEEIQWEAVEYDEGNWANLSADAGVLVVPGGVSRVNVFMQVGCGFAANSAILMTLYVNDAAYLPLSRAQVNHLFSAGANSYVQVFAPGIPVSPGDRLATYYFQDSGTNRSTIATDGACFMAVERIG